jgi:hypothetical protein
VATKVNGTAEKNMNVHLAQDRDQSVLKTVMNIPVPQTVKIS